MMSQVYVPARNSQDSVLSPLYLQVEATLREMIEDVEFGPGDQIPSERELSDMLGVSRMTVRRAIENLITTGLLERRSTSGTYVRLPQVVRPIGPQPALSISQMLEGKESSARLLHFEVIRAPRKVSDRLQLRVGEQVILIKRLRSVNDVPFCVETTYVPALRVPGLTPDDFTGNISFYQLLRQRFEIIPIEADEEIKIARCLPEEASLLGLNEGDPVLFMKSTVSDTQGLPIEYLKSVNHPDRVIFKLLRHPRIPE
jgi:GntR family transcriptional regulator